MSPSSYLRGMLRESRGLRGRLIFFVLCLAIGVAAVVAVAGLSSSVDRTIRSEARQLLAADVAVDGQRRPPAELDRIVASLPGVRRTDVRRMATIVSAPGRSGEPGLSQLVQMKVVDGDYPYYGKLVLDPDRPLTELLDSRSAVVAPELLRRLALRTGDVLHVGGQDFRIAGTVLSEPDRIDFGFSLGPRVFLSAGGLARTELGARGSRIFHRALLKLPEGSGAVEAAAVAERLREELPGAGFYEVETYAEAQPALRNSLRRGERFLGLVALLSLLGGGIGVAQTVRSWLAGRMESIAVLKCLGMRPREILALYLGETVLLGLGGSLVGAAAGIGVLLASPRLLGGLVKSVVIEPWQPAAMARGIGLGIGVAVLFAFPQLVAIRRVSPLRVLRRDVEPLPPSRWARALAGAALAGGIFLTALIQSRSIRLGAGFTAGLVIALGVLSLSARLLARIVGKFPGRFTRVWMRHGLAAVARPGADTIASIVALGLGTLVVLHMHLVETHLKDSLRSDLSDEAPTTFFAGIQPDQWESVRRLLERSGATALRSVPIVTARLVAVDGRSMEEMAAAVPEERDRRKWALTREQNLTYLEELPSDNRLIEGSWWSDPARPEVSVESGFARDLQAKLGSTLTFDVQGVSVDLEVTSLREVEWRSFRPNFFLVVEPGVLDRAPQLRVAAARLPAGSDQRIQDELNAAFPNILVIRIREVLEKVAEVLEKIGRGVRVLGGFTVLAGIAILAGAIAAGSVRRGREVALLKTLGMTRAGVIAVFAVEYALLGLVAGCVGAAGGGALAWAVVTRGMELTWEFRPLPFGTAVAGCAVLSIVAGTAASGRALSRRPAEILRTE